MKKVGYVCVYGRANVGKSTIINGILGYQILPVSSKPQTTRDQVHIIYNDDDSQIIFTDTPGIFKPHGRLGSVLLREAESAKEGVDLIVYVIDSSLPPDFSLIDKLNKLDIPIILAYNKIDLVRANIGEERLSRYLDHFVKKPEVIHLVAKERFGLDDLLKAIKAKLPEGDIYYPLDIVTDRPKEYIIAEFIREKCLRILEKEIPHSIYVDIKGVTEKEDDMEVVAVIIVEKESAKAIVIGDKGRMIARISRYSEKKISDYFGKKVYLDLHVKCIPDWRNSLVYLRRFGFDE